MESRKTKNLIGKVRKKVLKKLLLEKLKLKESLFNNKTIMGILCHRTNY